MNDRQIDFIGRWSLAFFAVLIVLLGWLGNSIRAGYFDILFQVGVHLAFIVAAICGILTVVTYINLKRPGARKNERN